jgi:hypothetical protein
VKKNYLKKLLLCIPIGLMLYGGSVSAETICPANQENVEVATTKLISTSDVMVNFDGVSPHHYYRFKINNSTAFCIDQGKSMNSNLTYKRLGTLETIIKDATKIKYIKKAWAFYEKYSGDSEKQFLAQVYIWTAMAGSSAYGSNTYNALYQSYLYLHDEGTARTYASNNWAATWKTFDNTAPTSKQLYVWGYIDGSGTYQRLISPLKDGEPCTPECEGDDCDPTPDCEGDDCDPTPEPDPCEVEIDTSNLITSCSSTSGSADEYVSGACSRSFEQDTKSNAYGKYTASYGDYCKLYCLSSITEKYPGNISTAVDAGRYIVWPNNNISDNQYRINAKLASYSLSFTLTNECKMLADASTAKEDYEAQLKIMTDNNAYANGFANAENSCDTYKQNLENAQSELTDAQSNANAAQSEADTAQTNYDKAANDSISEKEYNKQIKQLNEKLSELENILKMCKKSNGDCSALEKSISSKKEEIKNAKESYNNSTANLQSAQSTAETAKATAAAANSKVKEAASKVEAAQNAYNSCKAYKDAFEDANDIIASINSCLTATVNNALDFTISGTSSYNDPVYGGSFNLVESSKTAVTNYKYTLKQLSTDADLTSVTKALDAINSSAVIKYSVTKTYDLANGYYYYVDKKTNQSTSSKPSGSYSTIGFSNMPVSYESSTDKKYDLNLSISINGTSFDEAINSQTYTCHYEVTKTTPDDDCICPSGTEHEGENLDCLIANLNETEIEKYTCSEAKYVYCDSDINIQEYICPCEGDNCDSTPVCEGDNCDSTPVCEGDDCDSTTVCEGDNCDSTPDTPSTSSTLTCPNDASMDLKPCINAGYSYTYCANTFCNGKKYVCPSGTNEGMNLNACVIPMILKGYSEEEAYTYCKDITCPYGGIKIIYRTISLQNPFPSYNADKTVEQTGLTVGMFNDTVKGRYPGSNWNSKTVVKSKILNNRNVDGDEVYSQQPLYTFTLTSDTIKAIRKYNKSQNDSYSDFNLNCLKNNSAACVSDFVHNTTYGLTGGKCDKKLTANTFANCGS